MTTRSVVVNVGLNPAGLIAGAKAGSAAVRDLGSEFDKAAQKGDKGFDELAAGAGDAGGKLLVFSRIGVSAGNGLNFFATASTRATVAAKLAMHPLGATALAVGAIGAGALAGGAALAGFGAGLIGMGALALRNSQAAAKAVKDLGATVDGVAARSARVLEGEFVGALNKLSTTAKNAEPALTRMFTNVSPAVGELTGGLDGLVGHSLPGLEKASVGARDVLGDVAEVLPQLGDAVSDFGDSLGEAADGGGEALVDTLSVLGTAIRNTGNALEGTAKAYSFIKDLSSAAVGDTLGVSARHAADEVERLSQAASASEQGFSTYAANNNMAKAAVEAHERANFNLAASMRNVSSAALAAAGSEIAAIDANVRMKQELEDGTRTLDKRHDAGRRNIQAIHDGVAAAIRYGDAETKRTGNTNAGAAAQQRHTDAMYANAVAVLRDKGAVDALWRSLGLLPPSKAVPVSAPGTTKSTAEVGDLKRQIQTLQGKIVQAKENGASESSARVRDLRAQIAALHGKTVNVTTNFTRNVRENRLSGTTGAGGFQRDRWGGVHVHRAAEGLVQASVRPPGTVFQWAEPETGGEAFIPRRGDRLRSEAILETAASWYGMGLVRDDRTRSGLAGAPTSYLASGRPAAAPVSYAGAAVGASRAVSSPGTTQVLQPIQMVVDGRVLVETVIRYEHRNGASWRR